MNGRRSKSTPRGGRTGRPSPRGGSRGGSERGAPREHTPRGGPREHTPRGGPRQHTPREKPGEDLEVTYGLRAGIALATARPADVLRIAYAREAEHQIGDVLRAAEANGARVVVRDDAELARISGSTHHEGLCVGAAPRAWLPAAKLGELLFARRGVAIALDRVRNPYNVGAILRVAAFFGLDAAILGAPAPHPALAPDAVRVAEGGAERLALSRTTDLGDTLSRLRARGVRVYGADGASTESAIGFAFERPAILVVGHEREGMSARVRAECDAILAIPGSGAVESLNVAVATGVLVSEIVRDRS